MWHSLWSYHPRIGYTYMPSVRSRVPLENGMPGAYLVRTNSSGFRSDREFVRERSSNKFRAILFGDSQTAGDGVSNGERFSDLLEKMVPGLEIYNYSLTGTGTDQQYLTYLEFGRMVDHDLLILSPYAENVKRVNHRFLTFRDAAGRDVYYAKPYFSVVDDDLELHNIPVAKRPFTNETLPPEDEPYVHRFKAVLHVPTVLRPLVRHKGVRSALKTLGIQDLMQAITKTQQVPEYDAPDNPNWLLLRKILEKWIRQSPAPVLLAPIPMWTDIEGSSDPTGFQARFRELAADTKCHAYDVLPNLLSHSAEERRNFRFKRDMHLSAQGHQAMARAFAPVIEGIMRTHRVRDSA
jgi:hypothetical protein